MMSGAGASHESNPNSNHADPQLPICVKTEPLCDAPLYPNVTAGNIHKSSAKSMSNFASKPPQRCNSSATFESPSSLPIPGYSNGRNNMSRNLGTDASLNQEDPYEFRIKLEPNEFEPYVPYSSKYRNKKKRKFNSSSNSNLKCSEIKLESLEFKAEPLSNGPSCSFKKKRRKCKRQSQTDTLPCNNVNNPETEEPWDLEDDALPKKRSLFDVTFPEKKYVIKLPKCELDDDLSDSETEKIPLKYQSPFFEKHICEAILLKGGERFANLKETSFGNVNVSNDVISNAIKCDLPLSRINAVHEIRNTLCKVKNYEWEKLIDNEFISKMDDNIRRTVDSTIFSGNEYQRTVIMNDVIKDLNVAVKIKPFENRWYCFGPYLYGLAYNGTIINVTYECSSLDYVPHDLRQKLWNSLCFNKRFEKTQKTTTGVEISKIRTCHINSGKKIHITFSNTLDVRRSLLMKLFLNMNLDLKYLIVYVKLILKKFGARMNQPNSTHCAVFWLVVFFMQQKKLLPAVIDVRKRAVTIHHVSGWNCSLPENYSFSTEPVSLYSLLVGFFDFYKNFDYLHQVISPYVGRALVLSDFERLQMPVDEFSAYLKQMRNPDQTTFAKGFLNLQDPTDLSCNFGNLFSAKVLNEFNVVCQSLSESFPKSMVVIEQLNCFCHVLPDLLGSYHCNPSDVMKYEMFTPFREDFFDNCNNKLNQSHILEAIRRLMELAFRLEQKSIVVFQNFTRVEFDINSQTTTRITFPVMYFEYCSSENTWKSDYMKEIIPGEEPIRIYLRCEICLEKKEVTIFCQSNARFMDFLRYNFTNKFLFVLTEIMSR